MCFLPFLEVSVVFFWACFTTQVIYQGNAKLGRNRCSEEKYRKMRGLRVVLVETSQPLASQASPAHRNRMELACCLILLSLGPSGSCKGGHWYLPC